MGGAKNTALEGPGLASKSCCVWSRATAVAFEKAGHPEAFQPILGDASHAHTRRSLPADASLGKAVTGGLEEGEAEAAAPEPPPAVAARAPSHRKEPSSCSNAAPELGYQRKKLPRPTICQKTPASSCIDRQRRTGGSAKGNQFQFQLLGPSTRRNPQS